MEAEQSVFKLNASVAARYGRWQKTKIVELVYGAVT
jgi:hypothetical protein